MIRPLPVDYFTPYTDETLNYFIIILSSTLFFSFHLVLFPLMLEYAISVSLKTLLCVIIMAILWCRIFLFGLLFLLVFSSIEASLFGNSSLGPITALTSLSPFIPFAKQGSKCYQHVQRFLKDLKNLELWAIKMHDASGKLPSGLLNGNVHAFGDFYQCLQISENLNNGEMIKGKYCQVDGYLEVDGAKIDDRLAEALDLMLSHRAIQSDYYDGVKFFPTFTPITWGFCIPDSCSHEDVHNAVDDILRPLNQTRGLTMRLKSSENSCDVYRERSFHQGSALPVMLILWAILAAAVIGAFLEINFPGHKPEFSDSLQSKWWYKLLIAFSLKRNWSSLIKMDSTSDDISCVHGIRFIFSITIYLLHRGVFGMFVPFTNRTEIADVLEGEWTMIFRAFWNNVDSFVVLSGLLTSYYSVKKLQQGQKLNIWIMYAQRYYKFTPMYIITLLILRNLAVEMRTGPNAIRVVKHFVLCCKNTFWKAFFYLGNLDGMNEMCYPPAHQLITDMQMYMIAPAIVGLLWRFGKKGIMGVLSAIGILSLYKGYVIYAYSMGSFIYYGASLSEMLASANQMYLNPLHRLTPYLFGMMLGYIIRTRGSHIKLTQRRVYLGSCAATLAAFYSFFGPKHVAHRDYVFDARESALFGMAQPVLWSCALCWVIFLCHAGKGGVLNDFLSWKGFIIFTRLSYSFYLTQILVIFFGIAGNHSPEYMRMHQIVDLNELFVVMAMSVIFTLLFLLPLGELHQIMVRQRPPRKRKPSNAFPVLQGESAG